MSLAERLQLFADRRGVSAHLIAKNPEPYLSALEKIGIDPIDLTRELANAAERIDREIFGRIMQRVSLYNEFVKKLRELKDFRCQSDSRNDINSAARFPSEQKQESQEERTVAVRVPQQVAIDICKALGYRNADEYNVGLCQKKMDMLDDLLEEGEDVKFDKDTKKYVDKVLEALKDKVEVTVVEEGDEKDEKPAKRKSKDDDEDEEDEKPRRRRDDDDDEKPSKRKSKDDDDDEDEKPSRRSRDDDEDEEDEKPAKRKSKDDDEDEEDEKPAKKKSDEKDDEDLDEMEIGLFKSIDTTLKAILALLTGALKASPTKESKDSGKLEKSAKSEAAGDGKTTVQDIIDAILAIVKKAKNADTAVSAGDIVEKLAKKFPDKDEEQLKKRVDVWFPDKAEKELKVTLKKIKGGRYYIDDE